MTREDYLKYANLWDEVWSNVAKRQRWTDDTDPGEHISIDLEKSIRYNCDLIDSVLIFADGTVEFHYVYEEDAFNWEAFPAEINEDVLKAMLA